MRNFALVNKNTGNDDAEGVVFRNGKVAISWLTPWKSTTVYDSLDDAKHVSEVIGGRWIVFKE